VEGRHFKAQGFRMVHFAQLFETLGCTVAYNMDGGDSSQAYFNGNDIRVDEERELAGEAQRKLYDIICIGEVRSNENS
jgi:exopolysaccharide biosynthesis protein